MYTERETEALAELTKAAEQASLFARRKLEFADFLSGVFERRSRRHQPSSYTKSDGYAGPGHYEIDLLPEPDDADVDDTAYRSRLYLRRKQLAIPRSSRHLPRGQDVELVAGTALEAVRFNRLALPLGGLTETVEPLSQRLWAPGEPDVITPRTLDNLIIMARTVLVSSSLSTEGLPATLEF